MNTIRKIFEDYEKLIKTKIKIPVDNGDIIQFEFRKQDLPHLLGLQHLDDIQILFEYKEKRISASELFDRVNGTLEPVIDPEEFKNSSSYDELYKNRIQYFSSDIILDIIHANQIVKFEVNKMSDFASRLNKVDYIFWKQFQNKDGRIGYFGIGFMSTGKISDIEYPNTFFFRFDDAYIKNQKTVLPLSIMRTDKTGKRYFTIHWAEVWKSLEKTKHYKKIKRFCESQSIELNAENIEIVSLEITNEDITKEYRLLQLDALDKIYRPYMKTQFTWNNEEKRFIFDKIQETKKNYFPGEIIQMLNDYRRSYKHKIAATSEQATTDQSSSDQD